jgi:hypothetical protein
MNEDTINTHGEGKKNEIISSGGNLSVYSKINDPIHAMQVMGEMIAGSGMFGCTKTEQGMVLAMQCLAEGKPPLELAKTYHIIEGKLTMRADAMLGRYLTSGGKVKWTERSDKRVAATWICDGNEVEIAVTIEEMTKNGVAVGNNGKLKTNWQRFPRQMLTARNVSEAVRLLMPQIVSGIYTPEEVSDFSNNDRQVIPAQVAPVVQHTQPVKLEVVEEDNSAKDSLISRLDELLGRYEPHATNYLMTKGYLKTGQSYKDLDAMTAQRMLASPAKIIGILEGIK